MEPGTPTTSVPRNIFTSVTPVSKYLALALFILLPFIGGWLGYTYAPQKIGYVEEMTVATPTANSTPEVTADAEILKILKDTSGSVRLAEVADPRLRFLYEGEYVDPSPHHIFLTGGEQGGRWIETVPGNCSVTPVRDDLLIWNEGLKKYISDISEVKSGISCWYAGGGSEIYLYTSAKSGNNEVIQYDTFECGGAPRTECTGVGDIERLW